MTFYMFRLQYCHVCLLPNLPLFGIPVPILPFFNKWLLPFDDSTIWSLHTLYIYTEWLIKFETSTITVAGPVAVSLSFACSAAASSTTWHGRSTPAAAGDHLLHGTWYLDPSTQYHGLPGLRNQGCSVHSRIASQCTPCHQDPKLYSPQPVNKTKQHSHL